MITRIEALNFRCLRYVSQSLDPFHVLVGPNASGKTTFFDVVGFVSRLLNDGLDAAIEMVTPNPLDLLYGRSGRRFELAIEARLPEQLKIDEGRSLSTYVLVHDDTKIRYEVAVILDENAKAEIDWECVFLLPPVDESTEAGSETINRCSRFQRCLPYMEESSEAGAEHTTLVDSFPKTLKLAVPLPRLSIRREGRMTTYYFEDRFGQVETSGPGHSMRLSSDKSALAALLDDYSSNPASIWLKQFLMEGISTLSIDGSQIRLPSPPANKRKTHPNGLSLPWTVLGMPEADRAEWIEHIQTALPDIVGIRPVIREEDRHCYLMIQYKGLAEIPQWMISEGTLRLLALTLPAFSGHTPRVLMVEEPENGIHPKAIETVYQALSTVSDSQVLMTTHSPVVVNIAEPAEILCFAKDKSGVVSVVRGSQHPSLIDWQHDISLGTLFAAGVLE